MGRKRKKRLKVKKRRKLSRRAQRAKQAAETLSKTRPAEQSERVRPKRPSNDSESESATVETDQTSSEPTWEEVVEMAAEHERLGSDAPEPAEELADVEAEAWSEIPGVEARDLDGNERATAATPEVTDGPAVETAPGFSSVPEQAAIQREQKANPVGSVETAGKDSTLAGETETPEIVREVIASSGQSLDTDVRSEMEDQLGEQFADVQIHTGPKAAQACAEIDARAFTVGNHVVFNRGEYNPDSADGRFLIAHELTHVTQQSGGSVSRLPSKEGELAIDPDDSLEQEAERVAKEALVSAQSPRIGQAETAVTIQRHPNRQGRLSEFHDGEIDDVGSERERPPRSLGAATLVTLEQQLDDGELETLLESHIEDKAITELVKNSDQILSVTTQSDGTVAIEIEADFSNGSSVRGTVLYPKNTPAVFQAAENEADCAGTGEAILDSNNPAASWEQLSDQGNRADFVEKKLTPHVIEEYLGVEMLGVDTACGAGKNGIDGIAWDPDEETLHIVEAKWDSNGKSASLGKLGDNVEGTAQEDIQMTSGWIEEVWERGFEQRNINLDSKHADRIKEITNGDSLEEAISILIRNDLYEAVYLWASNDTNGQPLSNQPLTKFDSNKYIGDLFDSVINFKAGDINKQ